MRIVFIVFIAIHGCIHFTGFAKAFYLADIKELTHQISRPMGILWVMAGFLFIVTMVLFLAKKESWWMLGIPAVALSQVLIILNWQDARFGTIANAFISLVIVFAVANWSFNNHARKELKELLPYSLEGLKTIVPEMTSHLPPIVQQWLSASHAIGKKTIGTVHLEQTGTMRTSADGKWMPVQAEQWFTTEQPGFIWIAEVQAAPGIKLQGRDLYYRGKGHMLIRLLSLFPVADSRGIETDQGSLLRYLSEIIWFPSAALNDYIQWEAVDSTSAKATMRFGNLTESGIFRFDDQGYFKSFQAERYYDRNGGATLETWYIEADPDGFREYEGILVPAKADVTWKLKEGNFTWFKIEIKKLKYNHIKPDDE